MSASLLTSLGLPLLIEAVRGSLSRVDHPAAKGVSDALTGFDDALARGQISQEQLREANRHVEQMAAMQAETEQVRTKQVNESLRAEAASDDKFVRRMRPTFGYLMAVTWAAQMLGAAYVLVFRTEQASAVFQAMESLSMIWSVGLSVLGVYVYKRSEDKKLLPRLSGAAQIVKDVGESGPAEDAPETERQSGSEKSAENNESYNS